MEKLLPIPEVPAFCKNILTKKAPNTPILHEKIMIRFQ